MSNYNPFGLPILLLAVGAVVILWLAECTSIPI